MTEVSQWLEQLGLGRYADVFAENDVDEEVLRELTDADLEKLGVTLGHRKKLLKAIAGLADAQEAAAPTAAPPDTAVTEAQGAERRQLTVMFCDLVGSTVLSQQLDPEDLRELLAAYQQICADVVTSGEGYIARYIGDGLLIYFGYPRAHEDDAQRAVRAGLGIIAAIGQLAEQHTELETPLAVRIGITTGQVVVGDIGSGERRESMAVVGETPNIAARLQGLADAGSIVIGVSTYQLVEGLFAVEDLGPQRLKGIAEPVAAYRVLAETDAPSRFEAAATRGLTPLVGRDEEIGLLLKRWTQASEGEGQVALIAGEAGIGKSRILRGFQDRIRDELRNRVLYFCSPYHQHSPFYPVIDQLGRGLRFEPADEPKQKLEKLDAALSALGLAVAELAPLLAALLSIPTDSRYPPLELGAEESRRKTIAAVLAVIDAIAAEGPALMIVEDAHWIDPSTLELLDMLIERARTVRLLLVITVRPEFEARWNAHAHLTLLSLNRLTRRDTAALVSKVTAGKPFPDEVLDEIIARTDGVPLFVEELTKTIVESGLLEDEGDRYALAGPLPPFAIPTSLQDSLMARLDRLAPVKAVAQLAAAIGRTFSHGLLAAVSPLDGQQLEEGLARLVDAELVYRRGLPPDVTYEFKHALVRDVAYQSLLKSTRQQYHERIARAMEAHFPQTTETQPELLARHFTNAGLGDQAVGYWIRAGERSAKRATHLEAISHFGEALELLPSLPYSAERDRQEVGLRIAQASSMRIVDRIDEAFALLDTAEQTATRQGLFRELSEIHHLRGNLYFPRGDFDGCLREHQRALQYARDANSPEHEVRALGGLGDGAYVQGHMRRAYEAFRRCVDICRTQGFRDIEAANFSMVAHTHHYLNELQATLSDGLAAIELASSIGHHRAEIIAHFGVCNVLSDMAEMAGAAGHVERTFDLVRRLGARRFEAECLYHQANMENARGHRSEAQTLLEQAVAISYETEVTFLGPWILGGLALAAVDLSVRLDAMDKGEALLQSGCVGHNHLWFYRNAIEAALEIEDWDRAERYAGALQAYTRDDPLPWADYYVTWGRQLAAHGRGSGGPPVRDALEQLRVEARRIGMKAPLPKLENALATA